jgi:DNA-binding NarL/FixJ family response regulator
MHTEISVRVVAVEDDKEYQNFLRLLFATQSELSLVATHGDCGKALAQLEHDRPDVLLLDIGLPGIRGSHAVSRFLEKAPDLQIIMLTQFDDDRDVYHSLQSGALGYLLKQDGPDVLQAIRDCFDGQGVLSKKISTKLVYDLHRGETPVFISQREQEVLQRLCAGDTYIQIAATLHISEHTVRFHIGNLKKKFKVLSIAQLAHSAGKLGIVY